MKKIIFKLHQLLFAVSTVSAKASMYLIGMLDGIDPHYADAQWSKAIKENINNKGVK